MTTYYQPLFDYLKNEHGLILIQTEEQEIKHIIKNMETTTYYQPLFDYMSNEHGIHFLESEMCEIINIVKQMKNKQRIALLESEISRLKVANRTTNERLEAIESHLAEQHKGANFSKLNIPDSISDAPDYTHLLPEGYEFCSEEDAEKWVKVEKLDVNDNDEYPIGHIDNFTCFKGRWRPIRPIQYKVTTHEIVDAVPDPYMPDWSKAPEGTVAHVFNYRGLGSMWIVNSHNVFIFKSAGIQIPADLDWRQSLRVKPSK